MRYESPRVIDHGSLAELTGQLGNDPCSDRGPFAFKQTGVSDLVHSTPGNPNVPAALASCSP